MDFTIPADIQAKLDALDAFIEKEIKPLENQDDNIRFFDHRREHSRTDWDNDGQPKEDWEELLREMRRRADQILVVSRFKFTRDEVLETQLTAPGGGKL